MKESAPSMNSLFKVIIIAAALVVITAGMMQFRPVLIPLMMALFITIISSGPIAWLRKKGLSRWLSISVFLAILMSVSLLSAGIIGESMQDFHENLPEYQGALEKQVKQLSAFLEDRGLDFKTEQGWKGIVGASSVKKLTSLVIYGFGNLMTNSFLVLFLVVFMMHEMSILPERLKRIYGDDDRKSLQLKMFNDSVKQYMSIKLVVSLVTGALASLSLLVIGVDYPFMWGMLAFALNFVPNIGSIIAAIPPVLLALVVLGPWSSLAVMGCYVLINMVMGNIVEPRFMGKGLGLSTLVVFISMIFWGWVLGLVGMLLSVVLTLKVKIMLDSNEDTKWLGDLLGPGPPMKK